MDNDVLRAFHRLKRPADQVFTALHKHLNGHIVRDIIAFDKRAQDLIFRLGRGREADLDLFNADIHKRLEHLELFFEIHRIDQRLIAVAQIDRAPDRRFFDGFCRPCAVGNVYGHKREILVRFHLMCSPLQNCNKKSPAFCRSAKQGRGKFHAVPP